MIGLLAGLRGGNPPDRIAALADRLQLDLGRTYQDLSHGNKQKVELVQAFMHEPELVILDEPTLGLDPLMQREVRHLVAGTLRTHRAGMLAWVIGGTAAMVAIALTLAQEMQDFPGGPKGLEASIMPGAEAMRPTRWPAKYLDTLGGYLTYHNITLLAFFLAVYGALQGARDRVPHLDRRHHDRTRHGRCMGGGGRRRVWRR